MLIELPISKSIANRLLILQAIHGDDLMVVPSDMPDDVQLLHRALTTLKNGYRVTGSGYQKSTDSEASYSTHSGRPIAAPAASNNRIAEVSLGNCGTAMRFLTAYCAQLEGQTTILDGVARMHHRPIGQLVDALRSIGADIEYLGKEGFPPLRITGKSLDKKQPIMLNHPQSTQFVSALLLIGANVQTGSTSPYISLTREIIKKYQYPSRSQRVECERSVVENNVVGVVDLDNLECDWSSAAFWYEYVAIHGGEITLPGLSRDSLQGDKVVADIFAHLGVRTIYTPEGVRISGNGYWESITNSEASNSPHSGRPIAAPAASSCKIFEQDFATCPDLYPAVALTCERLGVTLHATGVESLPWKESDRLRAVAEHRTDADHRMAMALLIAGYEVEDTACISKSYPQFIEQWNNVIRSHA